MIENKKVVAIIPARGGSKGLPRKNIKPLLGKPLIAWSIEQAHNSKYIDRVVVSTDDHEIENISKQFGAEIPFLRPEYLASDSASTIDVILHAVNFFEEANQSFDILVLLEPTSPLRESTDIDKALEMLIAAPTAESIVGVSRVESTHPSFLVRLENNFLRPYINSDFKVIRRQDLEQLYFFEGTLYIAYTESLKKRKKYYHENALGYIVPKWKSFEVDDELDFLIIETILKEKVGLWKN